MKRKIYQQLLAIPEFPPVFGDYLFFTITSFVLLTRISQTIQAYYTPFSFFLLAPLKIIAKIFGSNELNVYLCACFSTMKSIITKHTHETYNLSFNLNTTHICRNSWRQP